MFTGRRSERQRANEVYVDSFKASRRNLERNNRLLCVTMNLKRLISGKFA